MAVAAIIISCCTIALNVWHFTQQRKRMRLIRDRLAVAAGGSTQPEGTQP